MSRPAILLTLLALVLQQHLAFGDDNATVSCFNKVVSLSPPQQVLEDMILNLHTTGHLSDDGFQTAINWTETSLYPSSSWRDTNLRSEIVSVIQADPEILNDSSLLSEFTTALSEPSFLRGIIPSAAPNSRLPYDSSFADRLRTLSAIYRASSSHTQLPNPTDLAAISTWEKQTGRSPDEAAAVYVALSISSRNQALSESHRRFFSSEFVRSPLAIHLPALVAPLLNAINSQTPSQVTATFRSLRVEALRQLTSQSQFWAHLAPSTTLQEALQIAMVLSTWGRHQLAWTTLNEAVLGPLNGRKISAKSIALILAQIGSPPTTDSVGAAALLFADPRLRATLSRGAPTEEVEEIINQARPLIDARFRWGHLPNQPLAHYQDRGPAGIISPYAFTDAQFPVFREWLRREYSQTTSLGRTLGQLYDASLSTLAGVSPQQLQSALNEFEATVRHNPISWSTQQPQYRAVLDGILRRHNLGALQDRALHRLTGDASDWWSLDLATRGGRSISQRLLFRITQRGFEYAFINTHR